MSAAARKLQAEALPLPADLPAAVLQRVAAHGVTTCDQWQALGRRRHRLFGITRRMVAEIDAAIAKALRA
jgi:hypothetical protein